MTANLVSLAIFVLLMPATAMCFQSGEKGPIFTNDGSLVFAGQLPIMDFHRRTDRLGCQFCWNRSYLTKVLPNLFRPFVII